MALSEQVYIMLVYLVPGQYSNEEVIREYLENQRKTKIM